MKKSKFNKLFVAFFAVAMLLFTVGFAQTDSSATDCGGTPCATTTASDDGAFSFFFTLSGCLLLISVVSGWVIGLLSKMNLNSTFKQIISWAVAVGVAFFGQAKGYGMFADLSTIETAAYGIGLAMVSNHLYDVGTLDNILTLLFAKKKSA